MTGYTWKGVTSVSTVTDVYKADGDEPPHPPPVPTNSAGVLPRCVPEWVGLTGVTVTTF